MISKLLSTAVVVTMLLTSPFAKADETIFKIDGVQQEAIPEVNFVGEVTSKSVVDIITQLEGLKGKQVVLNINSPGGSLYAGMALASYIKDHNTTITCRVDKFAASAAALVLSMCKDTVIAPTALILFHLPYMIIEDMKVRTEGANKLFMDFIESKACFSKLFTTDKEKTDFLLGEDFIISGYEYNKRKGNLCS